MRFIDTQTLDFEEGCILKNNRNQYAISYLTWKEGEDLTKQNFLDLDKPQLFGSKHAQVKELSLAKIMNSCAIAFSNNIRYL